MRGVLVCLFLGIAVTWGDAPREPVEASRVNAVGHRSSTPSVGEIRAAVARSLPLIESSAAEYLRQRECFSCHHQALSVLAVLEARDHGFAIDEENLTAQIERTAAHLERGRTAYAEGRGQGGQVDTAGWGLWTLAAAGHSSDETTSAVTHYLLARQNDLGHWEPAGRGRRPTQGSEFTATYLALRGLSTYAPLEQESQAAERTQRAQTWLIEADPIETEDRVFRLRALHDLGVSPPTIDAATAALLQAQHPDGGWAQLPDRASDVYATATVLAALLETGALTLEDVACQRGVAYLLDKQRDDGSWHVATRAKPIQVYFESGFPHGKDQFISMAATCWATIALVKACPAD